MTSIHIRGFRESDLDDVAGLVTELGYPSTPGEMKARLAAIMARPDHATFIATRSGVVVGMIGVFTRLSYEHDTPIGYVTCFVVRAEARGHGIGRALIAAAEGWALIAAAEGWRRSKGRTN